MTSEYSHQLCLIPPIRYLAMTGRFKISQHKGISLSHRSGDFLTYNKKVKMSLPPLIEKKPTKIDDTALFSEHLLRLTAIIISMLSLAILLKLLCYILAPHLSLPF